MILWEVLISTIPHRHDTLCELLAEFDTQYVDGFGVRLLRDNLERPHLASHGKRDDLIASSKAEYVSFVDDDDMVAHDYVPAIMGALMQCPDYVGFNVVVTSDGHLHRHASHSLRHSWASWESEGPLLRSITHLNPMRRSAAAMVSWAGRTDEQWSEAVEATGLLKTEVMIERDMYFYRHRTGNHFITQREPMPLPLPVIPIRSWLTVL